MAFLLALFVIESAALEVARSSRSGCPGGQVPWPTGPTGCEEMGPAKERAMKFLEENMPPWDVINKGTLKLGILPATVQQALQVRQKFSWAAKVPEEVWRDYVLPYASVNEARSDWRRLLFQTLNMSDDPSKSPGDVAMFVNEHLWRLLNPKKPINFKAQQTPLLYDSMNAISFGFASCTGLSILYLDALRSVGVPARLVGTPAWHGKYKDGNHNWVEIWLGEGQGLQGEAWTFIEAQPAGPGEKLLTPCDKWFCNPSHFDGGTQTYAAKWDREKVHFMVYPMSWDLANRNIPGVNRSTFYNTICGAC